jgi:hypothetical protein
MNPTQNPQDALKATRLVWLALMLGQVIMAVAFVAIRPSVPGSGAADTPWLLPWLPLVAVPVAIGIGLFMRSQIFKANWRGNVITPEGYIKAHLLAGAIIEAPSLLGLALMVVHQDLLLGLLPTAIALAVMAGMFPNGKPMHEPTEP